MSKKVTKLKKGHDSDKNAFESSPLIVWIALWIENTYSKFQVNIFSNYRDITKCLSSCTLSTMTTTRLWQYLEFSPKTAELKML